MDHKHDCTLTGGEIPGDQVWHHPELVSTSYSPSSFFLSFLPLSHSLVPLSHQTHGCVYFCSFGASVVDLHDITLTLTSPGVSVQRGFPGSYIRASGGEVWYTHSWTLADRSISVGVTLTEGVSWNVDPTSTGTYSFNKYISPAPSSQTLTTTTTTTPIITPTTAKPAATSKPSSTTTTTSSYQLCGYCGAQCTGTSKCTSYPANTCVAVYNQCSGMQMCACKHFACV